MGTNVPIFLRIRRSENKDTFIPKKDSMVWGFGGGLGMFWGFGEITPIFDGKIRMK